MQLQVVRRDGKIETITLEIGAVCSGRCIRSGATEHFFTPEGVYDGWGMDIADSGMNLDQAKSLIQAVETSRVIHS